MAATTSDEQAATTSDEQAAIDRFLAAWEAAGMPPVWSCWRGRFDSRESTRVLWAASDVRASAAGGQRCRTVGTAVVLEREHESDGLGAPAGSGYLMFDPADPIRRGR